MNWKTQVIILLAMTGIGYGAGRYLQPAEIKTEVKEVVKEVEVVKHDVKTVTDTVERPDGTKETHTVTEDHTVDRTKKDSTKDSTTVIDSLKPQWRVEAMAGTGLHDFGLNPTYIVGAQRRILGPFSAGIWGSNKQEIGISVSFEF